MNVVSVGGTAKRQLYIPVRKRVLFEALSAKIGAAISDGAAFDRLTALLSALIHHEYFAELERLRDGYAQLVEGNGSDADYFAFELSFDKVMRQANFEEIPQEELEACDRDNIRAAIRTAAPKWQYETVKFYRRGQHDFEVAQPRNWPLSAKLELAAHYDDLVIFVRFTSRMRKRFSARKLPHGIQPGSLLIKSFARIPVQDICMLYPDVRIRITRADALLLGAPAILGGIPILMSLSSAVGVVLLVLGAYLGYEGTVTDDQLKQAIGALAALVAAGAFLFRQYNNYTFKKLKYQKRIADSIYYHNVANHAGVFESLVGAAEDQDAKEAVLAYGFLLANGTMTRENLDAGIETWLRQSFREDIDFQIGDALAKLERLRLITTSGPFLTAMPLAQALSHLDGHWDNLYDSKGMQPANATA